MPQLVVADFSPGTGTFVRAETPLALGFADVWFTAATGACVDAPRSNIDAVAPESSPRPNTPAALKEPWAAALGKVSYVTRVLRARSSRVALVATSRGPNDVTDLWWCQGAEARLAMRSTPSTGAFELLDDGVGVFLDRDRRVLIRFHADREDSLEIALPPVVEPAAYRGNVRLFAALPASRTLVIAGDKRCYWMRSDELVGLAGDSARWNLTWAFPGSDPEARRTGTVTMCKWGVTNVELSDGKKQFSGDFGVAVGDTVTLVGKLWERLGSVQYREVERPDGSRIPMPGAPRLVETEHSALTIVTPSLAKPRTPVLPKRIAAQVEVLRAVGLFDEMTPSVLAEYCEGIDHPHIIEIMLRYYEGDPARAVRDRYLVHDWKFGQETDDVIAELSGLLGEPPLFRQLEKARDGIRVSGPQGDERIDVERLDDVVDHFNAALAAGTRFGDVRIYALATEDERHAYLALSAKAYAQLRAAKIQLR